MLNRDHCRINYPKLMKELKTIEKDYLPILPARLAKQYTELQETQQSFKGDAVFNAAARMVRLLHVRHLNLLKELKANHSETRFPTQKIFKSSPLMIPSKVPGKVYVFPNLIVDTIDKINLKNICWVICFDSLDSFNKLRAMRPNSWTPFFRGWKKIKKYEELSIMRALTRYTHISKVLTHGQIQAVEAEYLESIAPLELIYADKPKDYMTMFAEGGVGSCMATTGDKREAWRDLLKENHHPMSLFTYHPYIQGVYAVKNKKVIARTLLYKSSSGKWQHGRIFAINKIYLNKFENMLLETGCTQLNGTFSRKTAFTVPGIYSKSLDDYLLPVPYMDNVRHSLHAEFDREKKQFTVSFDCASNKRNVSCSSTGGYLKASTLETIKCNRCNTHCVDRHNSWDGRYTFCSADCANSSGYRYALTSDGAHQLRRTADCYADYFNPNALYTSVNSCQRNNGKRVIHDFSVKHNEVIAIQVHPKAFSAAGLFVVCENKSYSINNDLYARLRDEKLITSNYRLICSEKGVTEGVTV